MFSIKNITLSPLKFKSSQTALLSPSRPSPPISLKSMTNLNKSEKTISSLPRLSIRQKLSENEMDGIPSVVKPKVEVVLKDGRRICLNLEKPEEKTVRWLKRTIIEEMMYYGQAEDVIGFKTTTKDYLVDYVLSKDEHDLGFINETILITPIYKSAENLNKNSLKNFELLSSLGNGGFSKVFLARERSTLNYCALKIIDKSFIEKNRKQRLIKNELDILSQIDCPFLVSLQYAFKTSKFIVFVLEFCPGGDLYHLLRKHKRFSESEAHYYFVELLLAIDYLHANNIAYRDLKPENIIFDLDGHLKLTDFGLSKPSMEKDKMAYSFCGSPEYMSPEMLKKEGHSNSVDIYGLGLILYEMLFGLPPFYNPDFRKIFHDVLNTEISFPENIEVSNEVKDLIKNLLEKNVYDRLGCDLGISEIIHHPWIKRQEFEKIKGRELSPPFPPSLKTFDFEQSKENEKFMQEIKNEKDQRFVESDGVSSDSSDDNLSKITSPLKELRKNKFVIKSNNWHIMDSKIVSSIQLTNPTPKASNLARRTNNQLILNTQVETTNNLKNIVSPKTKTKFLKYSIQNKKDGGAIKLRK